jgi:predicted AAA+ superfamily ATPase
MYIERMLRGTLSAARRSFLLLGPRQTGKSTLIRSLSPELEINLADEETYVAFLRDPGLLKRRIRDAATIFIDEIQRIPSLLNTVQYLLDQEHPPKFFLTGSSARKLKRGKANLLPGRIFTYELGPLSCTELGDRFDVRLALRQGLLPGIYLEEDSKTWTKLLRSYAATYLKEEIQAEALTRNLEGFSRFFDVICSRSGDFVDFTKFASLASIERMSARRYFDVLVDTLVLRAIEPFAKSSRVRLIQHPRFYLYDVGVLNGALGNFEASSDRVGNLFEHLVLQLLWSEFQGRDEEIRLSVYRTEAGAEVDLILERKGALFAIEIKATTKINPGDLRGLKNFAAFYGKPHTPLIVYLGEHPARMDGVEILPLEMALAMLVPG